MLREEIRTNVVFIYFSTCYPFGKTTFNDGFERNTNRRLDEHCFFFFHLSITISKCSVFMLFIYMI